MYRLSIIFVALLACCVLTQARPADSLLRQLRELLRDSRATGTCGINKDNNANWDFTTVATGTSTGGGSTGGSDGTPPSGGDCQMCDENGQNCVTVDASYCEETGGECFECDADGNNCVEVDASLCTDMGGDVCYECYDEAGEDCVEVDCGGMKKRSHVKRLFRRQRRSSAFRRTKRSSGAHDKLLRLLRDYLKVDERVTGGKEVTPAQFPWVVYVAAGPYQCGGVLIGPTKVLTAAHCVETKTTKRGLMAASQITVQLGEHALNKAEAGEVTKKVVKVVVHPQRTGDAYDLAVLILESAVPYSNTIRPVCLPAAGAAIPYGKTCVGVGWGYNHQLGDTSPYLAAINLVIQTTATCATTADQICTKALGGTGDVCQGDSGGPLLCLNAAGAYEVIGIVSYGPPCSNINGPGYWGSVIPALSWINGVN